MGMILDKIRVLRLDPTACGGVTGAMQALALARASGTVVMPHVRTALNGQIAGTSAVMEAVETIPDMAASWEHRLMKRQPNIVNGELVLDQEPGNGIKIDWGEVESLSSNFVRIDFE
jgi:L-alanine-DL-glutamate epimerase-like enolase superfamily enzyme